MYNNFVITCFSQNRPSSGNSGYQKTLSRINTIIGALKLNEILLYNGSKI
jgi:hypothetical protein